jgi:hypothetical protein
MSNATLTQVPLGQVSKATVDSASNVFAELWLR